MTKERINEIEDRPIESPKLKTKQRVKEQNIQELWAHVTCV